MAKYFLLLVIVFFNCADREVSSPHGSGYILSRASTIEFSIHSGENVVFPLGDGFYLDSVIIYFDQRYSGVVYLAVHAQKVREPGNQAIKTVMLYWLHEKFINRQDLVIPIEKSLPSGTNRLVIQTTARPEFYGKGVLILDGVRN